MKNKKRDVWVIVKLTNQIHETVTEVYEELADGNDHKGCKAIDSAIQQLKALKSNIVKLDTDL